MMVSLQGVILPRFFGGSNGYRQMRYGTYLEVRRGFYYFRQTVMIDGKQRAKRFSLKTKDLRTAKLLSIQLIANLHQMIKKFEVQYDENNNIKSLKIENEEDKARFIEIEEMRQKHLAFKKQQEMDKLALEEQRKKKEDEEKLKKWESSEKSSIYQKLMNELPTKGKSIRKCLDEYIEQLQVKNPQTKEKYRGFVMAFVRFCDTKEITLSSQIDRPLVWDYIVYLRNEEQMSDNTIKNKLTPLSTFYNHLKRIGEVKTDNPFSGHSFKIEKHKRVPFTVEELNKIFTCQELLDNKTLFYITLILLTSGARPSEICQLYADDIKAEENNIFSIRITSNEQREQSIKNEWSDRKIYLHPILIKQGFIDYWKNRDKSKPLFDIKRQSNKNASKFPSEDFSQILRKIGINVKTIYYFRHTVINRMYQYGMKNKVENLEKIMRDMIGHDDDNKSDTIEKHYRDKLSFDILKELTEHILNYDEVKALH